MKVQSTSLMVTQKCGNRCKFCVSHMRPHEVYKSRGSFNDYREFKKRLEFTSAIVVKGTLTNESKFDFKSC